MAPEEYRVYGQGGNGMEDQCQTVRKSSDPFARRRSNCVQ